MRWGSLGVGMAAAFAGLTVGFAAWGPAVAPRADAAQPRSASTDSGDDPVVASVTKRLEAGRNTFRFDTFGDEAFWGDVLKLHQAIEGQAHGGVGQGVSPKAALGVGLKVDVDALPPEVVTALRNGQVNLEDPATTLALLKANAVVGVTGRFGDDGNLRSFGIQCALCHSRVDDSFAPGIGHRLDGWPNEDLDVGQIVNLSPDLSAVAQLLGVDEATVRTVLKIWGPGKLDAELFMDGKGMRPDGKTAATLIPPANRLFTEPGWNMHTAQEIGIDDFQANRSPDAHYRTTPLRGTWSHMKRGFYHDGRFATLRDVVDHYDSLLGLGLNDAQKNDLVEYVKSL